jgi:hypothetical protein
MRGFGEALYNSDMRYEFSALEQSALSGDEISNSSLMSLEVAERARVYGLLAWFQGNDLEAVRCFRRSSEQFQKETLEWAISERLYGLALIRVQREVEGTFALERADATLERFGVEAFEL